MIGELTSPVPNVVALILLSLVIALAYFCLHLWKELHSIPTAYVDCMVDTYVHGYLKKIIPDHGYAEEQGLKSKIMLYKDIHGLSDEDFPFNKMFILITASGYIPPLLDKIDEPGRIEISKPLNPLVLHRAGVDSREYKSAVYKIFFRGETSRHITVALEGAPPLVCLSDSCMENPGEPSTSTARPDHFGKEGMLSGDEKGVICFELLKSREIVNTECYQQQMIYLNSTLLEKLPEYDKRKHKAKLIKY